MSAVERGNILGEQLEIEYAIHGRYRRHEADDNGLWGCWYIPLKELVTTFGEDILQPKLVVFEQKLAAARIAECARIAAARAPAEEAGAE